MDEIMLQQETNTEAEVVGNVSENMQDVGQLEGEISTDEMCKLLGFNKQTISKYRKDVEQALNRHITRYQRVIYEKGDGTNGFTRKLLFLPGAAELLKGWANRISEEEFIRQHSKPIQQPITVEAILEEVEVPQLEEGLVLREVAEVDQSFADVWGAIVPQAVDDLVIVDTSQQLSLAGDVIRISAQQEIQNKLLELERLKQQARQEGTVRGMVYYQERRAAEVQTVQGLQEQEAAAKKIAELERQLEEAKKGSTKSRAKKAQ